MSLTEESLGRGLSALQLDLARTFWRRALSHDLPNLPAATLPITLPRESVSPTAHFLGFSHAMNLLCQVLALPCNAGNVPCHPI